ncbi:MAG: hypothetical protein ABWY18_19100, partial [Tardiphaga sp.]
VEKNDIGAIKLYDANSEFEISAAAAEKVATMIKRPDKEDNLFIEPLPNGPEGAVASSRPRPEDRDYSSKRPRKPDFKKPDGDRPDFKDRGAYKEKSWKDTGGSDRGGDKPRYDNKPKFDPLRADRAAPARSREDARFDGKPKFDKKPRDKKVYVAKANREGGNVAQAGASKPAFGKKKKNRA